MRGSALLSLLVSAAFACCSSPEPAPTDELPCDVARVLRQSCQPCHGSPPAVGVPVSLVTYADTQAPYTAEPLYRDAPLWNVIGDVVRAGTMPEEPVILTDADRATLLDWVDRGAPPAPAGDTCP